MDCKGVADCCLDSCRCDTSGDAIFSILVLLPVAKDLFQAAIVDDDERASLSSSIYGSTSRNATEPRLPASCTAKHQPVIRHQSLPSLDYDSVITKQPSTKAQVSRPPVVTKPQRKKQLLELEGSELETLKKHKEEMQQRVDTFNQMCIKTTKKRKFNEAEKKAFKHYSEKLLRKMKGHLEDLTQHGMDQHLFLEQSLKETYKPYGLILSALKLRSRKASTYLPKTEHKFTKDVLLYIAKKQSIPDTSNEALKNHISKALDLTFTMLTLLPPLIVCMTTEYQENFHNTFRRTWRESSINQSLLYYRPILVYGNRGHVAVKALVGNTEMEVED